jgi:hypothetical protein
LKFTPSWAVVTLTDLQTRRRPALNEEGPGADISTVVGASDTENPTLAVQFPTLDDLRAAILITGKPLTFERYDELERAGVFISPLTWPPGRLKPRDTHAPEPAGAGRVRGERSPQHAAALRARRGMAVAR